MFAVVDVKSKQFKVIKDEILCVPYLGKKKEANLTNVLLVSDGKDIKIGTPHVKGAKVVCDVLSEEKGIKRIAFKFKRRKSSQKKTGHRELLSKIKVKEIVVK